MKWKCMRYGCQKECWIHPVKGRLCLCQEHAEEVLRGEAKAPPIRQRIDYQSVSRKALLVFEVPEQEKKES